MEIRASDQDRERTVAALQRHTGAGRLTLDEFTTRVDAACAARTLNELGALVGDLPDEATHDAGPGPDAAGPDAAGPGDRRDMLFVFALAILSLLLLGGFVAVSRGR